MNAQSIFRHQIPNCHLVTNSYLRQIEQHIFQLRNFDLVKYVVTKEKDETYMFRNQIEMAEQNT